MTPISPKGRGKGKGKGKNQGSAAAAIARRNRERSRQNTSNQAKVNSPNKQRAGQNVAPNQEAQENARTQKNTDVDSEEVEVEVAFEPSVQTTPEEEPEMPSLHLNFPMLNPENDSPTQGERTNNTDAVNFLPNARQCLGGQKGYFSQNPVESQLYIREIPVEFPHLQNSLGGQETTRRILNLHRELEPFGFTLREGDPKQYGQRLLQNSTNNQLS